MLAILRNRKFRNAALQSVFLGGLLILIVAGILTAKANLQAQGMTAGFGFLDRSTGFDVGFSLIEFEPNDTYGKMIWVGILNTMFLGAIGIVLANLVGLLVAVARTSSNGTMNAIGTIYIEIFRNIPLILQTMFWYALLTHLPHPKQAYSLFDMSFLSSRGLYVPGLNVHGLAATVFFAILIGSLMLLAWFSTARRFRTWPESRRKMTRRAISWIAVVLCLAVLYAGRLVDTSLVSVPELKGLNIRGGIRIPPELAALAIAMAVYGGAYMAEIIRAGFLSVGKGQVEAGNSLGLSPWYVFTRIRLPLAIRAVLPTLINQYVWLFKATTLGIVIGFTDFFSVISVSINQSGQTLELIGILMAGFLIMNNAMSFILNRVNKAIALKGTQLRT